MYENNKLILIILFQILFIGSTYSYQSVVSTGNEISTSNYSMSSSTDMPDFAYYQNNQGHIQFGIHPPAPLVPLSYYIKYYTNFKKLYHKPF